MPTKYSKKRTYKKKTYAKKPSKALVKTIKKVVAGVEEVKSSYHQHSSTFDGSPTLATDIIRFVPNITTGLNDNERIGSKLKIVSLRAKGHLILKSNIGGNWSFCKVAVRLMCVQPKQCSNYSTLVGTSLGGNWLGTLLQKGSGTVGYTGTISDLYAKIDTDSSIVYYDKIHYLSLEQINTAVGAQGVRETVKFFNINIPTKKSLLYNDNLDALQPQNFNPVVVCGYSYLDGGAPTIDQNVSIYFDTYLDFTDS